MGNTPSANLDRRANVDPAAALKSAVSTLGLPIGTNNAKAESKEGPETFRIRGTIGAAKEPEARLVYLQTDDALTLTWRVETDIISNWLLTYVDAQTGEQVHGVVDYSADATYEV